MEPKRANEKVGPILNPLTPMFRKLGYTREDFPHDPRAIDHAGALLVNQCHGISVACGWYDDPKTGEPLPTRNFGERIALIHSEVSEALEGHRKNKLDDHLPHRPSAEVELADAVIRICDLAGEMGYDLGGAIAEKTAYNMVREDHKIETRNAAGGKTY
jgi:hypothetical protein